MPTGSFPRITVFNRQPTHVAKVTNPSNANRTKDHQDPLVQGIDENDPLPFRVLFNRLANPSRGAFFLALVYDGTERRIDIVAPAPFTRQPIEPIRQRIGARIKVEMELRIQRGVQLRGRKPVVVAVLSVANMELVSSRWQRRFFLLARGGSVSFFTLFLFMVFQVCQYRSADSRGGLATASAAWARDASVSRIGPPQAVVSGSMSGSV